MEREHQEVHPVVENARQESSLFSDVLLIVSLLGIGSQAVLLTKVVLIDHDIAVAGFSLFFYALFGIAYLLALKRANKFLTKWAGVIASLLAAASALITFSFLSSEISSWVVASIISLAFSGILSLPVFLSIKGSSHEK